MQIFCSMLKIHISNYLFGISVFEGVQDLYLFGISIFEGFFNKTAHMKFAFHIKRCYKK